MSEPLSVCVLRVVLRSPLPLREWAPSTEFLGGWNSVEQTSKQPHACDTSGWEAPWAPAALSPHSCFMNRETEAQVTQSGSSGTFFSDQALSSLSFLQHLTCQRLRKSFLIEENSRVGRNFVHQHTSMWLHHTWVHLTVSHVPPSLWPFLWRQWKS